MMQLQLLTASLRRRGANPPAWWFAPALALLIAVPTAAPAFAGDLQFLPGDDRLAPAVGKQMEVSLVEGGPGYLAIWTDERPVISGFVSAPNDPHSGNMMDVYGQIIGPGGKPLGPPIVIANLGRSQRDAAAAWNGENWLVAYETDDPAWYFDQNIYGVRISPRGEVLDPDPLVLFVEEDGQGAYDPAVASDGVNWLVVCDQWVNGSRVVRARRIAPDGTFIDAQPGNLQVSSSLLHPAVDFTNGAYLLATSSTTDTLYIRTFLPDLTPISPLINVGPFYSSWTPAIAANGNHFMVTGRDAHRIETDGTILDPAGIQLGGSNASSFYDVAWTGTRWIASMRTADGSTYAVKHQRVAADGTVLDAEPVLIENTTGLDNFESPTGIASSGSGDAQALFIRRNSGGVGDVRKARIASDGTVGAPQYISIGLPRQTFVRFAEGDGEYLVVYVSEISRLTRILSQRIAFDGTPIDLEPTVVQRARIEGATAAYTPEVAWNGSVYLVVWSGGAGSVLGKRLSAENTVIDQSPIVIMPDESGTEGRGAGAVAAAGEIFVVGGFHYIFNPPLSEPVRYVEFARVRGSDGAVLDPDPVPLAGGFSRELTAATVAGKAMLAWAQYSIHDSPSAYVQAVVIDADGNRTSTFNVSGFRGKEPDIAPSGDAALIVWHNDATIHQDNIEGRFVMHDGTLDGAQFLISGAPGRQMFPAAAFDGEQFVVAWNDFRAIDGTLEQLRGDIVAARVLRDGQVLDPDGFEVTSGPLPESLPAVAARNGMAVIMFSMLYGLNDVPEIQRLGYRVLGGTAATLTGFEAGFGSHLSGGLPELPESDDQYLRTRSDYRHFLPQR